MTGTNAGSVTNFTADCTNGSFGGVVYEVTTVADGTLTMSVAASAGSTLAPALIQQSATCSTDSTTALCTTPVNGTASTVEDLPAGTYYFVVAGRNATVGAFQLSALLAVPTCGDGVINSGEQCDLGSLATSQWQAEGCYPPSSATPCKTVPASVIESTCPGEQILIPAGTSNKNVDSSGTTVGFPSMYSGTCGQGGTGGPGPSRVYSLVPAAKGMLTVSVGYEADGKTSNCADPNEENTANCWDWTIFARTTCATSSTEVACSHPIGANSASAAVITFPVTAGTPYSVFVAGYDSGTYGDGPYNLFVTLQ